MPLFFCGKKPWNFADLYTLHFCATKVCKKKQPMGTLNSKNIALFDVAKLRVCHLFLQVFEVLDFTKPGSVFVTVQLATIQVSATKLLGFNAFVKGSTNVLGFILYTVARLPASSNDFTKSQSCSWDCLFFSLRCPDGSSNLSGTSSLNWFHLNTLQTPCLCYQLRLDQLWLLHLSTKHDFLFLALLPSLISFWRYRRLLIDIK